MDEAEGEGGGHEHTTTVVATFNGESDGLRELSNTCSCSSLDLRERGGGEGDTI